MGKWLKELAFGREPWKCKPKTDACMQISHDALNSASLKSSMGARRHICIDLQAFESSKTCEKSHVFDWGSTGKAICKSERDEPQTHSARANETWALSFVQFPGYTAWAHFLKRCIIISQLFKKKTKSITSEEKLHIVTLFACQQDTSRKPGQLTYWCLGWSIWE